MKGTRANTRTARTIHRISGVLLTTFAVALFGFTISKDLASAEEKPAADDVNYLPVPPGAYDLDPAHGIIGFGVKHLEINIVEGRFKDFEGSVVYDDKLISRSSVEFTAKIDSVDTGVQARDDHLKSADFFDVAKFPLMSFRSTKVEKNGRDFILSGDLTIKGITRTIRFPFKITGAIKDPWGGTRFGIKAETTINRRDFGINFGNTLANGGLDVGNEVAIELHIEAVKAE